MIAPLAVAFLPLFASLPILIAGTGWGGYVSAHDDSRRDVGRNLAIGCLIALMLLLLLAIKSGRIFSHDHAA
jgi:hypothetical protein